MKAGRSQALLQGVSVIMVPSCFIPSCIFMYSIPKERSICRNGLSGKTYSQESGTQLLADI